MLGVVKSIVTFWGCLQVEQFLDYQQIISFSRSTQLTGIHLSVTKNIRHVFMWAGIAQSAQRLATCWTDPSRPTLEPTHPPTQWIPGFFPGVKRPECDLTTHFHLASRLKKQQGHNSIPLWVFVPDSRVKCTYLTYLYDFIYDAIGVMTFQGLYLQL